MARVFLTAILALTGTAIATPGRNSARQTDAASSSSSTTTTNDTTTLAPVTVATADAAPLTPKTNVSLPYGSPNTNSALVNVDLTTQYPSLVLEALATVVSVDCAADAVSVVFASAADLAAAYREWSGHAALVLVTNHMGDCDTELERGFFTAESYTADEAALTLVAGARKSSIDEVASELRITMSGVQASTAPNTKRGLGTVTYSPDPVNFATELTLNETVLFSDDGFSATLESGDLSISVNVGLSLTYNVITSTLIDLMVSLETNTTSDLRLAFDINLPTNKTVEHTQALAFYAVAIPGVLAFGPQITFTVGAALAADAAVDVTLDLSAAVANGAVAIDYAGSGNVSVTGSWAPTLDVDVQVSAAAGVVVTPYVVSSFALDVEILGGAYNASGGVAPSSRFPTTVALDAGGVVGGGGGNGTTAVGVDKGGEACENGVELVSDFEFSVRAWVEGRWDEEYAYDVSVPVLDQCLSWE